MRKLVILMGLVLLVAGAAVAQDTPKAEIFAGYSYIRARPGGGLSGFNNHGGSGSIALNVNRNFGLVADFGGYKVAGLPSGSSASIITYLFGPRISSRSNEKITPFVQGLFGGARLSGGGVSTNGFSFAAGGGLDVKAAQHVAVRIAQFEYVYTRFSGVHFNNFRFSAGIVFRVGGK